VQLEVAYIVEVTKLIKYVTSKEDLRIQIVRIDRHITDSAVLQTEASQRIRERNKTIEGRHSREDKREMAREEDTWAVPT
jgi:hypothetical protein